MYKEPTKEDLRKALLKDAKKEKSKLEAMLLLIKGDDDCEAILTIDGCVTHAFSSSGIFTKIINAEITEINRAIDGQPNKWQ